MSWRFTDECDGSVVAEVHLHIRLKASGCDKKAGFAGFCDKIVVVRAGYRGGSGLIETGSPALACVAVSGELRHDEKAAADVFDAAIHLAGFVCENPQDLHFVEQPLGVRHGVVF